MKNLRQKNYSSFIHSFILIRKGSIVKKTKITVNLKLKATKKRPRKKHSTWSNTQKCNSIPGCHSDMYDKIMLCANKSMTDCFLDVTL